MSHRQSQSFFELYVFTLVIVTTILVCIPLIANKQVSIYSQSTTYLFTGGVYYMNGTQDTQDGEILIYRASILGMSNEEIKFNPDNFDEYEAIFNNTEKIFITSQDNPGDYIYIGIAFGKGLQAIQFAPAYVENIIYLYKQLDKAQIFSGWYDTSVPINPKNPTLGVMLDIYDNKGIIRPDMGYQGFYNYTSCLREQNLIIVSFPNNESILSMLNVQLHGLDYNAEIIINNNIIFSVANSFGGVTEFSLQFLDAEQQTRNATISWAFGSLIDYIIFASTTVVYV